jgi:hypothetical protein
MNTESEGNTMTVIKYEWINWDSVRPVIDYISNAYPCFVSVCRAMGYVRIECRKEDAENIKKNLKFC